MRKTWPIVLIAAAAAACAGEAGNNVAASQANGAAANQAAPAGNDAAASNAAGNAVGNVSADNGAPYQAHGTEPFWSLTIGGGEMVYDAADAGDLIVTAPAPQPVANGVQYATATLTVFITHAACSDGMSERQYADTVMVTIQGQIRNGCGGASTGSD